MTTPLTDEIRPQHRTIEGLSIRYAESEPRSDQALLLSPWPESIFCYEPTWSRLSEHTHLVAVDLPGFGQSERLELVDGAEGDGRICRSTSRRVRPRTTAPCRAGCRNRGFALRRRKSSRPLSEPGDRHGRRCSAAPARRRAQGMGGGAEPRAVSRNRRSTDRDRRDCNARALQAHNCCSPGLSRVLPGRAVRRIDALCARLPGAAARPERPAAYDRELRC